jgi:16S rRNA processing protein RimM
MAPRPDSGRDSRVCVAQIGAAHGLKGAVRLRSFTADPEAFAQYGPLETEDRAQRLEIESFKPTKDGYIVRFDAVSRREGAEALRGVNLYVDRERLPKAADDEFYIADLIGLTATTADGTTLGEVIAVHNFGAGDILELRLAASGETTLLAFDKATVPELDVGAGRLVVALPAENIVNPPAAGADKTAP